MSNSVSASMSSLNTQEISNIDFHLIGAIIILSYLYQETEEPEYGDTEYQMYNENKDKIMNKIQEYLSKHPNKSIAIKTNTQLEDLNKWSESPLSFPLLERSWRYKKYHMHKIKPDMYKIHKDNARPSESLEHILQDWEPYHIAYTIYEICFPKVRPILQKELLKSNGNKIYRLIFYIEFFDLKF